MLIGMNKQLIFFLMGIQQTSTHSGAGFIKDI